MAKTFADCNTARKRRARNKSFQCLGYICLVSRNSTNSEEGLARGKVQIEVACRKVLMTNGKNCGLRLSWWRKCEDLPLKSYCESVRNSRSASGQHQVVITEAVVGGTVVNGENDDKEERQCLFRGLSVDVFYAFLDYRPLKSNDHIAEGGIMHILRLDTCAAIVLTCLEQSKNPGGYGRKVYADNFTSNVS